MREEIVDKVRAAGVVGAGGAGFPTHIKLQFDVQRVLGNGASCEPLLTSDPYLMEHHPDLVLDGLATIVACTAADRGTICLKSKHAREVCSFAAGTIAYTLNRLERLALFMLTRLSSRPAC